MLGCLVRITRSVPNSKRQRLTIDPEDPIEMPTLDSLLSDPTSVSGPAVDAKKIELTANNLEVQLPFDHPWISNDVGNVFGTNWDPGPPKRGPPDDCWFTKQTVQGFETVGVSETHGPFSDTPLFGVDRMAFYDLYACPTEPIDFQSRAKLCCDFQVSTVISS
ncbi:hypothetical protein CSKR_203276 [Clonorchis sinensis]|uniref:Uncharacterized protein n=1 Tax=Clonorchis sinensis TaxID=79923 RepID=A0A8T1M9H6_CLOSI|nr:hypothetical protein CSKR_203276 [Clonorchis sinensis]